MTTTGLDKKDTKMTFLHISRYKEGEPAIEQFVPRVPTSRSRAENSQTERICVAPTLLGCLIAHPDVLYEMIYQYEENYQCPQDDMERLEYLLERGESGKLYRVYHFDVDVAGVVTPEELLANDWVHDAEKTQEHWLTKAVKPDRISYVFLKDAEENDDGIVIDMIEEHELSSFGAFVTYADMYYVGEMMGENLEKVYSPEQAIKMKEHIKSSVGLAKNWIAQNY